MKKKFNGILLGLLCFISTVSSFGQAVVPDTVLVNIVESLGAGCHDTTDNVGGIMCFDVFIKVDKPGWFLQSYNIWMNYGPDNTVLSYESDKSCSHTDGGDVDFDQGGLYRFLAASYGLALDSNEWVNFHNFCLDVVEFSGLENISVVPGGEYYELVSSINLVDQNSSSNAINPNIGLGNPFPMNESSFIIVDPAVTVECESPYLELTAAPVDGSGSAVIDCEPFSFLWTGPNGFQASQTDTSIFIYDPTEQSGIYEFLVLGANGCQGYASFEVDLSTCLTTPCEDYLYVNGPASLVNSKSARLEIIAQDDVVVAEDLTFSAPVVTLISDFEVLLGIDFETIIIGCP